MEDIKKYPDAFNYERAYRLNVSTSGTEKKYFGHLNTDSDMIRTIERILTSL